MANEKNLKPFKKGPDPRRNYKGRPAKLPALDKLLANVLGDEKAGMTAAEHILKAMRKKAEKGDKGCAELLLDRAFGKVAQRMVVDGIEIEQTFFILPNGRKIQI